MIYWDSSRSGQLELGFEAAAMHAAMLLASTSHWPAPFVCGSLAVKQATPYGTSPVPAPAPLDSHNSWLRFTSMGP